MAISKATKQVRDVYLGDLPEDVRIRVMEVHKLVATTANTMFNSKNYEYLNTQQWAKTMLEEFLTVPSDRSEVGSVRIYKQGKRYSCMIQLTAHVTNNRNTEDEEFFHGLIRNVHVSVRSKVRRKYDMKLTCESEHGEHFEGLDLWTKQKVAKELWELFEDKPIKNIKPIKESVNDMDHHNEIMFIEMEELPYGLQKFILESNQMILNKTKLTDSITENGEIGDTLLCRHSDGTYSGTIQVVNEMSENINEEIIDLILNECNMEDNGTKELIYEESDDTALFHLNLDSVYVEKLWSRMEGLVPNVLLESNNPEPEYNSEMSEAEAKKVLRQLSQDIINNCNNKQNYKVTQYTANIYANIITKNLLPVWAKGYRKFSITLDSYQSFNTLQIKTPKMGKDFVSRFVGGRETLNGFLHQNPEIHIKMSPRIFHTMKNPDDAFNFFKALIKYYDSGVEIYSTKIMNEVMKLNRELKYLVVTTKLSGIVTLPMQLLFIFDDVDMSNKNTFKISQEDINTVTKFIRNIYTRYAAPDKEKKRIINDLEDIIKKIRESSDPLNESLQDLYSLPEEVNKYFEGVYSEDIQKYEDKFIHENLDKEWCFNQKNPEVKYLQEKFGVKKLKKIPADTVAYITIETESIRDATDKHMIASYCISKIELVEWYIELLEVGSKKYIVPHSKPYLQNMRTQLLQCYKNIMDTKIPKPNERPLIDVNQYPPGYEG